MNELKDIRIGRQIEGWTWMDGQTDGQTDELTEGWID